MKLPKTLFGRLTVAGTVALFGVLGFAFVADAAVKPDCKNLMYPLCPRSVAASQVVDNSLPKTKIVPADREAFLKDTNTPDVKGDAEVSETLAPKAIEFIGGPYFDPARGFTHLGTVTLTKGTWLVNTSVKFTHTAASPAGAPAIRPQVGLRIGQNGAAAGDAKWGTEVGTVGGSAIGAGKNSDLWGSAVKLITVDDDTEIGVYGFGYADGGTEGSGEIIAAVQVVAVRA